MRRRSWLVLALAFVLVALPAAAKGPNKRASRLDKLGKKAYAARDWDEAVASFEAAYGADPLPRFLFNIGRSYEKKGDVPKAIESFERYLEVAEGEDDQDDAEDRLAVLGVKRAKGWGRVEIAVNRRGATLHLHGRGERISEKAPFSGWLAIGKWRLVVDAEGFDSHEEDLDVTPGDEAKVRVTLEETGEAPVDEPEAEPEPEPEPEPVATAEPEQRPDTPPEPAPAAGSGSVLPWVALGTGVALLAGGAVVGLMHSGAVSRLDDLKGDKPVTLGEIQDEEQSAKTYALVADGLFGLGAAAAIGGVVMLLMDDGDGASAGGSWWLGPLERGTGLTVGGQL